MWGGMKRNEIHQIRRDWPDGLGLEGKEVYRVGTTRKGGECVSECICGRWRKRWEGGGNQPRPRAVVYRHIQLFSWASATMYEITAQLFCGIILINSTTLVIYSAVQLSPFRRDSEKINQCLRDDIISD